MAAIGTSVDADDFELSPPVPARIGATEFKKKFGNHCQKSLAVEMQ
jgi:hypothetical protein